MSIKIFGMGRLAADPEIRTSAAGGVTARLRIISDRRFKKDGQPEADGFTCKSFGKQAEFVEKYLKKGTKIVVTGTLQNDNYTDKEGNKRYQDEIILDTIEFAESAKKDNASSEPSVASETSPVVDDDEMPFN